MKTFDWDSAKIIIKVPTDSEISGEQIEDIELSLTHFMELLMTSVDEKYFSEIPTFSSLPFAIDEHDEL